MALSLVLSQSYQNFLSTNSTRCPKSSSKFSSIPQNLLQTQNIRRRKATAAGLATVVLLAREAIFCPNVAYSFDFRITAPDQTLEEAESTIRAHAQDLLDVKDLIAIESWGEAQKALRKSSSYLKQDIYTIIQAKPGIERPQLRKLYSLLFNNVTRLDYAARSKDIAQAQECYENIVAALGDILSRI
uniref:PsbQ-like protein 3, chloroplastic n=1 Tax=Nelumbo nucifera TaxID=4432 RepID=A0A822YTQ4_NELNU|nr:TPA_asm: hypothetical protein HUJ06_011469 [Nelumbo nucifera]